MDIQLLHLTTFNGYKYSIIYLFVSVINNYSQNISFANSLKMQKQGWSSRRADCCDHSEIRRLPLEYLDTTAALDGWETVQIIDKK